MTGASAGSVNGFLSAVVGCRSVTSVPEESPFYKVWIDLGLGRLRQRSSTFDALFDAEALVLPVNDAKALLDGEAGWSPTPCDGIFGVTATRLEARRIAMHDPDAARLGTLPDVTLARQTEKFLLAFDVGGKLKKPRFSSYRLAWENGTPLIANVYPALGIGPATTPGDVTVSSDDIATLLRASAAFPLAFGPVAVPMTLWERGADDELVPHAQRPRFLDGGLLENTPLSLAQKAPGLRGMLERGRRGHRPPGRTILFSKSDTESWRRPPKPQTLEETDKINRAVQAGTLDKQSQTVLGELGGFAFQFLNNATDLEALEALEGMATDEAFDRPDVDGAPRTAPASDRACRVRRRIVSPEVPPRGMPVAGQFLGHFGAFLERDFRVFDFHQGIVDAQEHAEKHLLLNPVLAPVKSNLFTCFHDYRTLTKASGPEADPPALPASCDGVAKNQRTLLRASARVRQRAWLAPKDDEFVVFLTALHEEGFKYQTLAENESLDADEAQAALREKMHHALHELGRAQGSVFSPNVLGVSVGAKVGADLYRHRAPVFIGIGFTNGLELAAGLTTEGMRSDSGRFTWKVVPSLRRTNPEGFSPVDGVGRLSNGAELRTIPLDAAAEVRLEIDLRPWVEPVQVEIGVGYDVRQRTEAVGMFLPNLAQPVSLRHGPLASFTAVIAQRSYVTVSTTRWLQAPCRIEDVNVGCSDVEQALLGLRTHRAEPMGPPRQRRLALVVVRSQLADATGSSPVKAPLSDTAWPRHLVAPRVADTATNPDDLASRDTGQFSHGSRTR